ELDEVFDHLPCVDVVPDDFIHFVDAEALVELHHENPGGCNLVVDLRNNDKVAVVVDLGKAIHVLGFMEKVHLFGDHPGEFIDDGACGAKNVVVDKLFENEHQVLDDANIRSHEFFHAWTQDLDDNLLPAVSGPVYLS